jgi:hypothetical protein
MTEEIVEKKIFEKSDFKFNTAYGAYSEKFEQADDNEERNHLNEMITKLEADEITYPDFYEEISKPSEEEEDRRYRFHRSRIQGTRKFAARRAEQKSDRIKRHKR